MAKEKMLPENDYTPVTYDPQYILMVNHLKKYFPIKGQKGPGVQAVEDVSFAIHEGETLGRHDGSGRRVRLRQVHDRPHHPASGR